jgi:hypothetical protein
MAVFFGLPCKDKMRKTGSEMDYSRGLQACYGKSQKKHRNENQEKFLLQMFVFGLITTTLFGNIS